MRFQELNRWVGLLALGVLLGACKVTQADITYWKGTVKGPGKIVAVMQSDRYPMELRAEAAVALVEMERNDVDGVTELQRALQRIEETDRQGIIDGMTPRLEGLMRGGDQAATDSTQGPPPGQVRAKDAAYLLIAHASAATRARLTDAVVGWYRVDFHGRSLSGAYSAEQVIRSLGSPAANALAAAMSPEMPQQALVKLSELVNQLGDAEGKARAGAKLVEIETHMESAQYLDWIKGRIRDSLRAQNPSAPVDENRVTSVASLNRETFINDGALAAMKHLAGQAPVAARLLAIAESEGADPIMTGRRTRALQALEGNATRAHLDRLLTLALNPACPISVRDYSFDRIGDIGSADAIPRLWPLFQAPATEGDAAAKESAQRLRWRAGELILALGGPGIVPEFFTKLPSAEGIAYEPEELEGYAQRLSQMTPPPTDLVRGQLQSPDWWDRIIALRYYERRGAEGDVAAMNRLTNDADTLVGAHWRNFEQTTVGQVARAAIAGLRERLSGAAQGAAPAPGAQPTPAPAGGPAAPAPSAP